MSGLIPYGPASGTDIGDLYVETDEDQLFLSGSLSLPNDPASLPDLRRLIAILVDAEHVLTAPMDGSEPAG